jgi:uncharacterized Zn-binding protein involved in type VI secretion
MKPIVLIGHHHSCPIHGIGVVTSGSEITMVNNRPVARIGDSISCGAKITTGSPNFNIDGRPVAREGDSTDHGGTLIEGEENFLIE